MVLSSVQSVKDTMSKNLIPLFFVTSAICVLLFASFLALAAEKGGNSREQLNPEAQTFNTLGEEFKVHSQVFDGFREADPNNLLWNRADDIIVLDSTLFQKDSFAGVVPSIYFSLNQQDILPSMRFSTIGIGILFYLNR